MISTIRGGGSVLADVAIAVALVPPVATSGWGSPSDCWGLPSPLSEHDPELLETNLSLEDEEKLREQFAADHSAE